MSELAAIDAAAALHHVGHRSALCALEGSSAKGANGKILGELSEEAGFEANQLRESVLPAHLVQSLDLQRNYKSKLEPHNVPCPEISIEFKYSLLCYAGALLQHSAVRHEVSICVREGLCASRGGSVAHEQGIS